MVSQVSRQAKILLVDDRVENLIALDAILSPLDQILVSVQSGQAALEALRTDEFAVVLLDIVMPGMSGLDLLPKAKALRPDVPIIMITAYGDAETKRKALENGAEALLTKPIDFGALRSEIDMRVGRSA